MWEGRARDTRPSLGTGYRLLDEKLFRNGFQPGTFVILGGRTHTRKTGVALNFIRSWLVHGLTVGLVGLDEPTPLYVAKLASVLSNECGNPTDAETLELQFDDEVSKRVRAQYSLMAKRLVMSKGYRPDIKGGLQAWYDSSAGLLPGAQPPQVVVIDYLALLARGKYSGQDNSRIPRLAEDLSVFANENECVVVALHQVGRQADAMGRAHHGDKPVTLEQLKYGGEEMADVVLGTYRPAADYLGGLEYEDAEAEFGDDDKWEQKWERARVRVRRYEQSTFLQLLKNRPSQKGLLPRGIELFAPNESMLQEQFNEERHLTEELQDLDKELRKSGTDG